MHNQITDLSLIRAFIAIYDTGRVTEAALALGLSQSATSHALGRLRTAFEDELFVRTKGGMQPTPFADQLAESLRGPLEALDAGLQLGSKFDPETSTRTFKLYMSDVGQIVTLPQLLSAISKEAPKVRVHVCPVPVRNPQEALVSGDVDLAIGYFTNLASGFMQRLFVKEEYVCIVRKDHRLFENGMSLEAFEEVPHAIADRTGMAHEELDRQLLRMGLQRKIKLRVPQFLALPQVAAASDLMVIMPSRLASIYAEMFPLKLMPLPVEAGSYEVRIFWHERYHKDPANVWLRRVVASLIP